MRWLPSCTSEPAIGGSRSSGRHAHGQTRRTVRCRAAGVQHLVPAAGPAGPGRVPCHRRASPGSRGLLIVEAFVPDHTRWTDGKRLALSRWMTDGIEIEAARHDRAHQTIEVRYLAVGARTGMRPLSLRYAWPAEIDLMARLAGLDRIDRWDEWSGTPFDAASTGHVSLYRETCPSQRRDVSGVTHSLHAPVPGRGATPPTGRHHAPQGTGGRRGP